MTAHKRALGNQKLPLWILAEQMRDTLATMGCNYVHRKSGDPYEFVGLAVRESDGELLANYSPEGWPSVVFSRPLTEFLEKFEAKGKTLGSND